MGMLGYRSSRSPMDPSHRLHAIEGVCMSSYIISKGGQDDAAVVHQLDEIYQMLLGRYEFEKHKMEAVLASTTQFPNALLVESTTSACCIFCPEMLCRKPGFEVRTKVACFLLELWYQLHQSLWSCSSKSVKNVSQIDYKKVPLPCILFQPTKTATLDQILHGTFSIKDYPVHSLKLRVASRNLWQDAPLEKDLPSILLSTACSHFQQIICAHKKSFSKNEFGEIQSIFGSMEENPMTVKSLIDDAKAGMPLNVLRTSNSSNAASSNSMSSLFPAGSAPPLSPRSISGSVCVMKRAGVGPSFLGSPLKLVGELVREVIPQEFARINSASDNTQGRIAMKLVGT